MTGQNIITVIKLLIALSTSTSRVNSESCARGAKNNWIGECRALEISEATEITHVPQTFSLSQDTCKCDI